MEKKIFFVPFFRYVCAQPTTHFGNWQANIHKDKGDKELAKLDDTVLVLVGVLRE